MRISVGCCARIRWGWLGVAITLLAVGCGDADPSARWAGTVRDSAGVTIIENPDAGVWAESAGWTLQQDLRIGSAHGDADYQFGDIAGIGVTSDGRVVVFDGQAERMIRVFDRDGVFLTAFGTSGSGPGEFGAGAGPVLIGLADTIAVPDRRHRRVNVFTDAGEFIQSFRIPFDARLVRWEMMPSGRIALQLSMPAVPGRSDVEPMDALIAISADGQRIDSLLTFPPAQTFTFGVDLPQLAFFAPDPWWTVAPDGAVWHGINDEYRVASYADGAMTRTVSKPFERVRVTPRDEDAVIQAWAKVFSQMPNAAERLSQMAEFHDVFPAFQQFAARPDGTLWVQPVQIPSALTEVELDEVDPRRGWGSRRWDVFDGDGRYLGVVELPRRFRLERFDGDRIYGVWLDDLDVQYVVRLRVVR